MTDRVAQLEYSCHQLFEGLTIPSHNSYNGSHMKAC